MYKTVIWATDGSDGSEAALQEALRLTAPGGRLVAVHCDERMTGRAAGSPVLADEDEVRVSIRRRVESLEADGVPVTLVVRQSHHDSADVVAAVAVELEADVIVCGTRGHGTFAGALARSSVIKFLGEAQLTGDDSTAPAYDVLSFFWLQLDLSSVGWAFGLLLVGSAFQIGTRMQKDTEALV